MPVRDGTGPMGEGPMTGRGAGDCVDDAPGYTNSWGRGYRGRGFARGGGWFGRRGGFGRRNRFWQAGPGWGAADAYPFGPPPPPTKEQEAQALKQQASQLKGWLKSIESRIDELQES